MPRWGNDFLEQTLLSPVVCVRARAHAPACLPGPLGSLSSRTSVNMPSLASGTMHSQSSTGSTHMGHKQTSPPQSKPDLRYHEPLVPTVNLIHSQLL